MAKEMIECSNCWKLIEKKGVRTMCIKCTNLALKIRAEQKRQTEEYKQYQKEWRAKKEGLI